MTLHVLPLDEGETKESGGEAGLGTLQTERGNLPLESIEAAVRITGLVSRIELTQGFHNPHDVPLEATYIFPLPDRAAVTAMRLTADDRTVRAELRSAGPPARSTTARSRRGSGPRSPRRSGRTCSPCGWETSCRGSGSASP